MTRPLFANASPSWPANAHKAHYRAAMRAEYPHAPAHLIEPGAKALAAIAVGGPLFVREPAAMGFQREASTGLISLGEDRRAA